MGKALYSSALAAAVALAGWAASAVAQERPGRAIRVERLLARAMPKPRVLGLEHGVLRAYGWEPAPGDAITFVGGEGVVGTGTLTDVTPSRDPCRGRVWDAQFRVERQKAPFEYGVFALHDAEVADDARAVAGILVSPPKIAEDKTVWVSLDSDGSGEPDMMVTNYPCPKDDLGRTLPGRASCVDTYVMTGPDEWERRTHDVWHTCN